MLITKPEHISRVTWHHLKELSSLNIYNFQTEYNWRKDRSLQKFTTAEFLEQKLSIQLFPWLWDKKAFTIARIYWEELQLCYPGWTSLKGNENALIFPIWGILEGKKCLNLQAKNTFISLLAEIKNVPSYCSCTHIHLLEGIEKQSNHSGMHSWWNR